MVGDTTVTLLERLTLDQELEVSGRAHRVTRIARFIQLFLCVIWMRTNWLDLVAAPCGCKLARQHTTSCIQQIVSSTHG